MNFIPRPVCMLSALVLVLSFPPPCSAAIDDSVPDAQTLAKLELRAQQAKPREQCFLYAELLHTMTELAGRQILEGNAEEASATLKKVEHYAQLIHLGLADDPKRLKSTEMLLQHTTYRLQEYLHSASGDDRATLQNVLVQLNRIEDELLISVFRH
jgi:hypothetical protein